MILLLVTLEYLVDPAAWLKFLVSADTHTGI